jgi:hypothetical protein
LEGRLVESESEALKVPKKVWAVLDHYNECFVQRNRCLHCNDCIAFALIYSEALNVKLPPRGVPYMVAPGHAWNFVKFLGSTISREYLPCDRALPYEQVRSFAWSLLRLPMEARQHIRAVIFTHTEFSQTEYDVGVKTFKASMEA